MQVCPWRNLTCPSISTASLGKRNASRSRSTAATTLTLQLSYWKCARTTCSLRPTWASVRGWKRRGPWPSPTRSSLPPCWVPSASNTTTSGRTPIPTICFASMFRRRSLSSSTALATRQFPTRSFGRASSKSRWAAVPSLWASGASTVPCPNGRARAIPRCSW